MASSRVLGRFSSRLKSLCQNLSNKNANVSSLPSPIKSASPSSATSCRLNRSSRLPVELSSMIPLHSAIASSRLVSSLSVESKIWGLVPQGQFLFCS
ncbi:unnamed protein product [Arabidopsis thaliana]|uniref:Uncharacterized protein n=1 Tax=Arabidopsis thaliana TaxID=3702 RepID=A0A178V8H6_ARATH|nr:hypothetical protein AXX17_AT3G14050 [Arabidopsis thaliana]VYS57268.1 unnamed protein product [Arabidopsis thaliana]